MKTQLLFPLLLAMAMTLPGCASFERNQGVANAWRDPSVAAPVRGQTTESDIIEALGPPSQVIGLRDQTVFYYLTEHRKGKGAIFLIYNWVKEDTIYDRAIFFFDRNGVLTEYGFSKEKIAPPR
jgi:outer membrane protein assembly factor BamE (lipoprotein component of BamABCDE complex)